MMYRFGSCVLDEMRHRLSRDGAPVHVEPQVFALITSLVQARGDLVSKDELIATVWKGLNVSDATISARINAARVAVGDTGKAQAVIRTVPRCGFQLVVPVETEMTAETTLQTAQVAPMPPTRFGRSSDGAQIAYTHHGTGPPLVRVSHWLSHLELDWDCPVWRPMLDRLGQSFTLFRYDQRGTGLSTRDLHDVTLDAFVEDLRTVTEAAGLKRFPLFAASQATPVAIRFAVTYPERISHLVLYGGYAQGRVHRTPNAQDVDEHTMLALIRAGWGQGGSAFLNAFGTLFMPDATPDQMQSFLHIQKHSISPEGAAILRQAVDRFDVSDELAQVQAPSLVIHAQEDPIHPLAQARLLASTIPDAKFTMLQSRNHVPLPQDQSWSKLIQAIEAFCSAE